ncbi:hypothetical protein LCGC14_1796750 [marine sediment metagenome]|uniref:DUF1508 domain-containing protein n=1 Tax=marine sediment metagenome TaxID=412755 RepID=A0A0F9GQV9_9ZZZZ
MPYVVEKRTGKRPWKILDKNGKVMGSSTTKSNAEASVEVRLAGAHGWRSKG